RATRRASPRPTQASFAPPRASAKPRPPARPMTSSVWRVQPHGNSSSSQALSWPCTPPGNVFFRPARSNAAFCLGGLNGTLDVDPDRRFLRPSRAMNHPAPLPPVREGQVLLGKYRVDRVIGAGGMGVVVQATHLQLDQKVAL